MYTHAYACFHILYIYTHTFFFNLHASYDGYTWWRFGWYLSVYMSSYCCYLQSPASPIIDFKWKVSHCACKGWRGKRLKWFLCVSRLSKASHTGFYSWKIVPLCLKQMPKVTPKGNGYTQNEGFLRKGLFVTPQCTLLQKFQRWKLDFVQSRVK